MHAKTYFLYWDVHLFESWQFREFQDKIVYVIVMWITEKIDLG